MLTPDLFEMQIGASEILYTGFFYAFTCRLIPHFIMVSDAPSLIERKDQELGAVPTNGPNQAPYVTSRGDMLGRRRVWDLLHPIPLVDSAAHES